MKGINIYLLISFFWACRLGGGCAEGSGAARSALASPCRSAIGDPRGGVVRFLNRVLSSAAARARRTGIPSPLNVHRFILRPCPSHRH